MMFIIYIQDPGPGALVPILSSMARQGTFFRNIDINLLKY